MPVTSSVGPVSGIPLGSRSDLGTRARPEPAVDIGRLQVGAIATSEIAFATRRPDVADVASGNPLLDELIFLGNKDDFKF